MPPTSDSLSEIVAVWYTAVVRTMHNSIALEVRTRPRPRIYTDATAQLYG